MRNTVRSGVKAAANQPLSPVVLMVRGRIGAPRNGAAMGAHAPKLLTGCVSEISNCALRESARSGAFKDYAAVYAAYQDYLAPARHELPHDYDGIARSARDGCLDDGLLDWTLQRHRDAVSDDDIEGCGYLGWLQHC